MIYKQKKGQYSVEMIILIVIILGLQLFFFVYFSDERLLLSILGEQEKADAQFQEVAHCILSVESLGLGSSCEYYLAETIGGRNFSLALYEDGPTQSLLTDGLLRFGSYVGNVNQTYTSIPLSGNMTIVDGEVVIT